MVTSGSVTVKEKSRFFGKSIYTVQNTVIPEKVPHTVFAVFNGLAFFMSL